MSREDDVGKKYNKNRLEKNEYKLIGQLYIKT